MVRIDITRERSFQLILADEGLSSRIRYQAMVSNHTLIDSVLAAAGSVLSACTIHGWWSDDIEELAAAIDALQQEKLKYVN